MTAAHVTTRRKQFSARRHEIAAHHLPPIRPVWTMAKAMERLREMRGEVEAEQ
jgi:hypothetical protein